MSSFHISAKVGEAPINLVHTETKTTWLRVYPYYDNWPIYKRPTHYVIGFRLFGFWFSWTKRSRAFARKFRTGATLDEIGT